MAQVHLYKIKVTSVDYCVEEEDLDLQDYGEDAEDPDIIAHEIAKVKSLLPQTLELEIECEPEDLDDQIADAISEETGWLNNSFTYDIVSDSEAD